MKKIITLILAAVMIIATAAASVVFAVSQNTYDINSDGTTDNKDVVTLFRYLSGSIKADDESIYDYNGDGEVNNKDVVELFKSISGSEAFSASYEFLLYKSGDAISDGGTARYSGKDLTKVESYKKEGMEDRAFEFFGSEYTMKYWSTTKHSLSSYGRDNYEGYTANNRYFIASVDENSGKVVNYSLHSGEATTEYIAPITADSDEDDFVNYAKTVLSEYAGVSVDGLDVEIKTARLRTSNIWSKENPKDGFIKYTEPDPEFTAEYQIRFFKKIDGVKRNDAIYVYITEKGEVLEFCAMQYDEAYEPFLDVQIDVNAIMRFVERITSSSKIVSHETELRALPDGDALWVEITISYEYLDSDGYPISDGSKYMTKVAGSSYTEPEPGQTM